MAILSCEPTDIRLAGLLEEEAYKQYISQTSCLKCPHNQHYDYPVMGGHITASYCE